MPANKKEDVENLKNVDELKEEEKTSKKAAQEEKDSKQEVKQDEKEAKSAKDFEKDIKEKDEKIASLNDRLLRNMAEFDNYRKRTEKEKSQMLEQGATKVLEKILPIVDNFERALATENAGDKGFKQGIELIYKQVLSMLDELDVKEIEAMHKPFDPDLHHAVLHEENDEYDESTVVNVMQKGYTYKGKVIRYSMVSVAN